MNSPAGNEKIVEVSAAVLQLQDERFLLAQRPTGKIWSGYWEFPGGKVEAGEAPYDALVRELHEELGITVTTAYPWITRVYKYPHATVRLNFFRVTAWSGELHPHEGQQFSWQKASDVTISPLLPANAPVLRSLGLPMMYAISNVAELGEDEFLRRLDKALVEGLRMVQLREKGLSKEALCQLALKMLPLMKKYGARLFINADIELAKAVGADGVHLVGKQLAELKVRPRLNWCAASCHSIEELRRAETLGCDMALLSPVLPTRSHPGIPHLGWGKFAELSKGSSIPIYALGGLTRADMEAAWKNGAHGIALLRHAW